MGEGLHLSLIFFHLFLLMQLVEEILWLIIVYVGVDGEEKVTDRKREKEGKRWSSTSPRIPVPVCTSWMACRGAWCFPATGSWTGSWRPAWPPRWRSDSAPRIPAPSSRYACWSPHPFTCSSSSPPCPLLCWASSSGLPCRQSASPTCTPTAG